MRNLTDAELAEAELDLRKLRDPAWGGFNLLYGDGYYAKGLENKWGVSLEELGRSIETIKAVKSGEVHAEPVEFANCPAENCVICNKPTRTWLNPHIPMCKDCASKGALKAEQDKAAKEVIDGVLIDEAKKGLKDKTIRCQEADMFLSREKYVPCGRPGHAVVWSDRDNRPYVMCEMCADHAVRNRGMRLIATV